MRCVFCPKDGRHDWREGLKLCDDHLESVAISMIERGEGRHVHKDLRRRLERAGKVKRS